MNKSKKDIEAIDLVYLWVDGDDPKWLEKKQRFLTEKINTKGRYQNNEELKYSLRSVEKHMPWVRKIFIVTDDQVPKFLNINHPKIQIVDHSEIIPKEILPTFNSTVLEYFLYRISDLSEHFIYSNDDMFINSDVNPSFFFKNGLPVIRMKYNPFFTFKLKVKKMLNLKINTYRLCVLNGIKLAEKKYHKSYPISSHHNMDSYLKSDCRNVIENTFKKELQGLMFSRFRDKTDAQRIFFTYDSLARNRGHLKYVKRDESCLIHLRKGNYERYIDKYNPKLFCLNDSEHVTDEQREDVVPFLEKLFPKKSSFEK